MSSGGFVKLMRGEAVRELMRTNKNAFVLLAVIATRARYTKEASLDGLTFGEAFVGDHLAYDMTRKEYSWALKQLSEMGLVSFRSIPGKGTIARLNDSRVFSIVDERKCPKQGQREGQLSAPPFSEVNPEPRGDARDSSPAFLGTAKGQLGDSLGTVTRRKEGKKEQNVCVVQFPLSDPQRATTTTHEEEAFQILKTKYPHVDCDALARAAKKSLVKRGKWNDRLDLNYFEEHWIRREGPKLKIPDGECAKSTEAEPAGWRKWMAENNPDYDFAKGGDRAVYPWGNMDHDVRNFIRTEMQKQAVLERNERSFEQRNDYSAFDSAAPIVTGPAAVERPIRKQNA